MQIICVRESRRVRETNLDGLSTSKTRVVFTWSGEEVKIGYWSLKHFKLFIIDMPRRRFLFSLLLVLLPLLRLCVLLLLLLLNHTILVLYMLVKATWSVIKETPDII